MPSELERLVRSAEFSFRLGLEGRGSAALADLVDRLGPLLASRAGLAARVAPHLGALVAAQERGDWIGLADGLGHEFLPALLGEPAG